MSQLRGILRVQLMRYVAVAIFAFVFGSTAVVLAAPPEGFPVIRIGDRSNPLQMAAVDSAGNVAVSVSNVPTSQTINGAVSITNFPTSQQVTGTVNVGNFPASQAVSGTVSVSNFPATQNVNIVGGTLPSTATTTTKVFAEAVPAGGVRSGIDVSAYSQIHVALFLPCGSVYSRGAELFQTTADAAGNALSTRVFAASLDDCDYFDGVIAVPGTILELRTNLVPINDPPLTVVIYGRP